LGVREVGAAVADAGPLIHLNEGDTLHLLALFSALHVPSEVWRETVGKLRVPERAVLDLGAHCETVGDDLPQFVVAHGLELLHPGEQECLYVCHRDGVAVLLTDDLAARNAAKRLGIMPVGSLGIIVRAYRVGRLNMDEAERAIRNLQTTSSLFVTSAIIGLALEQLRQFVPAR
jgi:predicted nucleic acid-binding protein